MQIGFIGAGNMAPALARGWGEPVLCTDSGSGRAAALAAELGGEALASNRELAERADVVILAHKPAQLADVAAEIGGAAKAVVSMLAGATQADVRAAYPGAPVLRLEPNTPVEVGQGVLVFAAPDTPVDEPLHAAVRERFARLGTVVEVPERLMAVAGACSGVAPAYWALLVEAQVDAAVSRGLPVATAQELIVEAMAGTAALLRARYDGDTLAVRRAVASPGGTTARGLAALERGGVRAAFAAGDGRRGGGRLMELRTEIADFLSALITVYTLCIIAWIVVSFVFSLGARVPVLRAFNAVLDFLRDVSEPYLRIFRRLGLRVGPLDLSPIVAIIVLRIVGVIVGLIASVTRRRAILLAVAVAVARGRAPTRSPRRSCAARSTRDERVDLLARHRPRQHAQHGRRVRLPHRRRRDRGRPGRARAGGAAGLLRHARRPPARVAADRAADRRRGRQPDRPRAPRAR